MQAEAVLGNGVQRIVETISQAVFLIGPPIGMGAGLELRVLLADSDRLAIGDGLPLKRCGGGTSAQG